MTDVPISPPRRTRLALAALALLAGLAVVATLDAAGDYPHLGEGPGLTVDEMFNVGEGCRLVRATGMWMAGAFHWRKVFGERDDLGAAAPAGYHLADHPPLGRFALGLAHEAVLAAAPPSSRGPSPFVPTAARVGSALAFAWLVYVVGLATAGWYGPLAGVSAALALILMPRVFAHAHLASLEMMITLAYTATVISLAERWSRPGGPRSRDAVLPGLLLGLALLTKIQAVLLAPPVAAWAVWHWRLRAVKPLMIWASLGAVVFLVGWPWIWIDPLDHLTEYFARTTQRASLSVWYLGIKSPDNQVAWHYPLVMFATTVPLGRHVLACCGRCSRRWRWWTDPRAVLLAACTAFPVLLFAIPGLSVYDGARLFLVVFPLWAVLAGRGTVVARDWLSARLSRGLTNGLLAAVLVSQAWGVIVMHPCGLGFYNLAVGGPAGAERLGLEPTYWGDSLTRGFLAEVAERVPEGETIAVFPSLHPAQWTDLMRHARIWGDRPPRLALYGTPAAVNARFIMIFRRKADLPEELRHNPRGTRCVAEVRRAGVLLAALFQQQNPAKESRNTATGTYTGN